MRSALVLILSIFYLCSATEAKRGFGPGEQDYGYVTVRSGAHMFWWLYHTTANVSSSTDRPLVIWLQGGPGGSSCGYGNFEIIGPLDLNLEPRNYTWVNDYNLLLIDNPVGTGYSYVERSDLYATDNKMVARDLVTLMKGFYERLPEFRTVPLYIFGQSYGGKMAADFALLMWEEQTAGNIQSNIQGFAMGNAWIHPVEATLAWGRLLYQTSLIDMNGFNRIQEAAELTKTYFENGDYFQSTVQWGNTQRVVLDETDGVDFYNILNKENLYGNFRQKSSHDIAYEIATMQMYKSKAEWELGALMNGPVKEALGIPSNVVWGSQSNSVFQAMYFDFMSPVVSVIEEILDRTPMSAVVYNGNIDLICDTAGQKNWVKNLTWSRESEYRNASRDTMWLNGLREGYRRVGGGFGFFWVNVAGHSAPKDNPPALREVLRYMTGV